MVSTLGVVGEHFSVAHPSHGQVGFIPGVVKLSQGDLVFPFQVIITAHWPCASMPSPCKSRNEHGTTGVWDTYSQILSNPCWMTSLGFDKLLAFRGPLVSSRTWFMRSGWIQKSSQCHNLECQESTWWCTNCHFKLWFPAQEEKEDINLPGGFPNLQLPLLRPQVL